MSAVAIALAGGLGRRIGGDKALHSLAGRPLLSHVIERIRPQAETLAINANGDPARFARWGVPVIPDTIEDNPGPLAGILAGMEWAQRAFPTATDILSVPTDTPFLPPDLVDRLCATRAATDAEIVVAASLGRTHPVIGLWPIHLKNELRNALLQEGLRKVEDFANRYRVELANFTADPIDPFYNLNRPEEFVEAEKLVQGRSDWTSNR